MTSPSFKAAIKAMNPQFRKFVRPLVVKFMDVSTAHITKADNASLSSDDQDACGDLNFDRFGYGYYVWVPDRKETDDLPVSDAFKTVLHYARENGFRHIKLDCDGPTYPQLETHDW